MTKTERHERRILEAVEALNLLIRKAADDGVSCEVKVGMIRGKMTVSNSAEVRIFKPLEPQGRPHKGV